MKSLVAASVQVLGTRLARLFETVARTSSITVWPESADRARHVERRAVARAEESHELEALFGDALSENRLESNADCEDSSVPDMHY
jgi:hypothetical protein